MGADFSGLQEYTKPDGTVVKMPPQLAAAFGASLTPVQPTPPLAPDPQPQPQPGPAWPMEPNTLEAGGRTPELQLPEPTPQADAALMSPEQPGTRPAPAPQPKPQAVPPKAPRAPALPTDADLSRVGLTGVLGAQNAAVDTQAEATRRAAEAEAASLAQQGDALAARNEQVDKILQQRQAAAEDRMRRVNEATIAADKAYQAYADHKIDRSIDHPRLALVGLLLGAVGSSMKGEGGNPAMDMLMKQQDRSVQAQMAEREKLRDVAAYKRGAIETVRQAGDDNISMYNLAMAGETEKTIRQIEQIKARSGSAQVKANADVAIAGLQEKKAGFLGEAVNRRMSIEEQQAARRQAAAEAAANRGLRVAEMAQADRHFYDNLRFQREKEQNDLAAELAKLQKAGKGSEADLLQKRGIGGAPEVERDEQGNIKTGPDGRPAVNYGLLKNRDGSYFVPRGSDAAVDKLREKQAASQRLVDILDQVRAEGHEWLSDTGNSDKLQRLRTLWGNATLVAKDALDLGAIQGADMALIKNYLGSDDPTKFRDATAGIEQARKNIVASANTLLRAYGFNGEWSPTDLAALNRPVTTPEDKSAQRVLQDPNRLESAAQELDAGPGGGRSSAWRFQDALRAAGGMLPSQRATIDMWARAAKEAPKPEDRRKAYEWLAKFANEAQAPAVREYATGLLQSSAEDIVSSTPVPSDITPQARVK